MDPNTFVDQVSNEIENNRFDYNQNENGDGDYIVLTEENPNGFLCDYQFYVDKVTQEIDYTFETKT